LKYSGLFIKLCDNFDLFLEGW